MKLPVIFALMTALFWGMYGPALGQSRGELKSPFKPYVAIGIAYLIWGIIGGVIGMLYKGDTFDFTGRGATWGLIAGTLGAWGALTLTLAMFSGGIAMPHIVMPIVFGGAVTVSAIVSVITTKADTNPLLWVGIVGIGICIGIVAYFTPHAGPPHKGKAPSHGQAAAAPQETNPTASATD